MYKEDLKRKKAIENYWLRRLSGKLPKIYLPFTYSDKRTQEHERASLEVEVPKQVIDKLLEIVDHADVGLFIFLLSGLTILLDKYTGVDDLIIGTVNPRKEGVKDRLLFCRQQIPADLTFKEVVMRMKQVVIEAFNYSDYSFGELYQKLVNLSGKGTLELFNVAFIYDKIQCKIKSFNQFNLVFVLSCREGHWVIEVEYNSSLYPGEMIRRISRNFVNFFQDIKEKVNRKVSDLDILCPGERAELLKINETGVPYPSTATIHELFEKQAAQSPDNVAVVVEDHQLTYGELNAKTNRLARMLRNKGVKPDTIVGILMDRSLEMIIAIIGILKAGGAYLPIDPETPGKRIASMLDDSGASLLLSCGHIVDNFKYTYLQGLQAGKVQIHLTSPRQRIEEFDSLDFPDRSLVDYKKYNCYIGQALVKNRIMIQASRGCPHNCSYCYKIWPRRQVSRSGENIFKEIELYYNLGIRKFDIFMLNFKEGEKLFRLIVENKKKNHMKDLELYFPNGFGFRGDLLTKEYIDLAVQAGTINLALALETASPRLQKLINKHLELEKFRENIEYICEKYPHVILELFTMHGIPTETQEEAMITLDFIKSLKWVHFPYVNVLKIYQNTGMETLAIENGVSREAILESEDLAWHEWSNTLPFDKSFTTKYQADFLSEYVLSKERLLAVLPHQMKILSEDELIEKYNSYLPQNIKHFNDLLELVQISWEELAAKDFRDKEEDARALRDLNRRLKETFPQVPQSKNALRIILLDLSQFFTYQGDILYDVVDAPLGLMYLLTYLNCQLGDKVKGKILKSRIDFDSYEELKEHLEEFKPDIIGIRSLSYYKDLLHKTAAMIRQWEIGVPIITGGPYATVDYKTLLQDRNIDMVVLGEGELTFYEIVKSILNSNGKLPEKEILKEIPGIAFVPKADCVSRQSGREILVLEDLEAAGGTESRKNLKTVSRANNLAYVIFTSGSTGKPKGVPIEHQNVVNVLTWFTGAYRVQNHTHVIQLSNYTFDPSVEQIFGTLISGGVFYVPKKELIADREAFHQYMDRNQVNIINFVPRTLEELICHGEPLRSLRAVISGGEKLEESVKNRFIQQGYRLYNQYGPTETTIDALQVKCSEGSVVLGKPIANARCYILGKNNHLVPIGITGEIHIGGAGVARGYINNPELTAVRFVEIPHLEKGTLYRTGDYARYLPNRGIDFLGRMDHQVKINGYRIELEEIESQLLSFHKIKETAVTVKEDEKGENYLCAYIVSDMEVILEELNDYLSRRLPYYMLPQYLARVGRMPLTSSGKIDRASLPTPEKDKAVEYVAPRNQGEKTLSRIWAELLDMDEEKISIDANFFELGGQSLKATVLMSKIHKVFNVKLTLGEIFKNPSIRGLGEFITRNTEDKFVPIAAAEEKEYFILSSAQKRLYISYQLDRDSIGYNMMAFIQLGGVLEEGPNAGKLENAFRKLIHRHESLRTSFHMINDEPVQRVHEDVEFKIEYYEVEEWKQGREGNGNSALIRPFDLSQAPLLRVSVLKDSDGSCTLVVDMHHIISDGVSQGVLEKDFTAFFKGKELPPLRIRYKDFAQWQRQQLESGEIKKQEKYWLNRFKDRIPFLNLPTNYPRTDALSPEDHICQEIHKELTQKIREFLSETESTMFIFLLAIYTILLSKYANQEDIAVGCPIADRTHDDLNDIIGMFVNLVTMRNSTTPSKTFRYFLEEVKKNSIKAFENQNYPFEELVSKLGIPRHIHRNPLTDILFDVRKEDLDLSAQDGVEGDEPGTNGGYQQNNTANFDIIFDAVETPRRILLRFNYRKNLFKRETMEKQTRHFLNIIEDVIANPDMKISQINMLDKAEMDQLKKMIIDKPDKTTSLIKDLHVKKKMEAGFDF
jgi:amino acid adenylation domain-containing protein